jgi:putative membrane protein
MSISFKRTRFIHLFAIVGLAVVLGGCEESMQQLGGNPSPNLSDGDNNFYKTLAIANMTEIDTSNLALTQSQNQAVKDFAQKMIDDHSKAENELASLAAEDEVTLPSELDAKHQSALDDLKALNGPDFDKAYIDLQVKAHKQTIAADEFEADNGMDSKTKGLANNLLDTLKMHLSMAEKLQSER